MNNLMNWYRFLGCLVAKNAEEFMYFYSLFNTDENKTYGKGIWNIMYGEHKSRAEYQRRWHREHRRKVNEVHKV